MAQKHHPDCGGDESSFQLVQMAYDKVKLSNDKSNSSIRARLVHIHLYWLFGDPGCIID